MYTSIPTLSENESAVAMGTLLVSHRIANGISTVLSHCALFWNLTGTMTMMRIVDF